MTPILGNPAGLWALACVPAIVAVHFLQQRARIARTSTWFLIEKLAPDSVRGRTWDNLRNSRTLWFQLLAAIAVTWVLVEPRWARPESAQTIVVVLDASASMDAFREKAIQAAEREMTAAEGQAACTTWVVMTTNPRQPALYRGPDRAAAAAALTRWQPELGQHDFTPALQLARGLSGIAGRSLLITDTPSKVPPDQRAAGVGHIIENVGFAGSTVAKSEQGHVWRAVVKNHAATSQQRTWFVESGSGKSTQQTIELTPGGMLELSARWPDGVEEITLVLSADEFESDDRLPLTRPVPKPLSVAVEGEDSASLFFRKIAAHLEGVSLVDGRAATLRIARLDGIAAAQESRGGIFWSPADRRAQVPLMKDPIVPEREALVSGLNWQGWIGAGPQGLLLEPGDVVLLWQGGMPLVFLSPARSADAGVPARGRKLMLSFDWDTSNAGRLPAMVLLAERFLAQERDAQRAPYSANFDCGATIPLSTNTPAGELTLRFRPASRATEETMTVPATQRAEVRAPSRPGHFMLSHGDEVLVRASAQFSDSRQGDFRAASTFAVEVDSEKRAAIEHNTTPDRFASVWLACVGVLLLASWWTRAAKTERAPTIPPSWR